MAEIQILTDLQADYACELFNLGMGEAAVELSELVDEEVLMSVPVVQIMSKTDLLGSIDAHHDTQMNIVELEISSDVSGSGSLIYPTGGGEDLARTMIQAELSPEFQELSELEEEALIEVSEIVLHHIINTFSEQLNLPMNTGMPQCRTSTWSKLLGETGKYQSVQTVMTIRIDFAVRDQGIKGEILFLQDITMVQTIIKHIDKTLKDVGLI